jgi:hypothetical protein
MVRASPAVQFKNNNHRNLQQKMQGNFSADSGSAREKLKRQARERQGLAICPALKKAAAGVFLHPEGRESNSPGGDCA